jgi:hypothetical protein
MTPLIFDYSHMDKDVEINRRASINPPENATGVIEIEQVDHCVICLEVVSHKSVAKPCCHQSFDFICLVSWLQERSTCPLCTRPIKSLRFN